MIKTIDKAYLGKLLVRLTQNDKGYSGVAISGDEIKARVDGGDADDVWRRIHDKAARLNPHFIGFDGARLRFLRFFSDGFAGSDYVHEERQYKLDAKSKLDKNAPLAAAATGSGYGEAVLAAYRGTNLLSPFEKVRLEPLLRGGDADPFIRAAAAFANGDTKVALSTMKAVLQRHDCAKWTVVTYLPFLWKPDHHAFLKPTMVQQFAERVGHPFAHVYQPGLDPAVYESLLDLANTTKAKVADLEPRDMIDVQSFMWTAVEYTDEDLKPRATATIK